MSHNPLSPTEMRKALLKGLPPNDHTGALTPTASTYLPPSHAKALDRDTILVEGIRGAGKSFWFSALNSAEHRTFIAQAFPEVSFIASLRTSQGFGTGLDSKESPTKDILKQLVEKHEPRNIWKAVVAAHLGFAAPFPREAETWEEKVRWVAEKPEPFDILLAQTDQTLLSENQTHIVLFDALDRLADDWQGIRPLARALLQLALELRSAKMIRLKIFMRTDMLEDEAILSFPDSSKLLINRIPLLWRKSDLFALLYQCLGNAGDPAKSFRDYCSALGATWEFQEESNAWTIPKMLRDDEDSQKKVFHALAGPAMGGGASGHKRGFPYTWLPNHLLDGREQVSPRSFVSALRSAAEKPLPEKWGFALHFDGIKEGVQEASSIRVNEISEDYPWVKRVMEPLRNLTVPCAKQDILKAWEESKTVENLQQHIEQQTEIKLPPQHLAEGARGVLKDLVGLGVLSEMSGEKIQMPDVYRVAFGLGRRGGVRPLR